MSEEQGGCIMRLSERIAKGIGIDESYVTIIASRNNLYAKYESFEIEKIKELNNGLIKVLLIPYVETNQSWDYFISMFNNWILNIKILLLLF